ncbi:MAG TPA: hypothetical protein VKT72_02820 [Candidatus Baltobacteraceae bacterium]|nr:hypothetical protein [Candidatus Baltobacteraceae bacterium]
MRPRPHADAASQIALRISGEGRPVILVVDFLENCNRMRSGIVARQFFVQNSEIPQSRGNPGIVRIARAPILQRILNFKRIVLDRVGPSAAVMQVVFERENHMPDPERTQTHMPKVFVRRREL